MVGVTACVQAESIKTTIESRITADWGHFIKYFTQLSLNEKNHKPYLPIFQPNYLGTLGFAVVFVA